MPVPIRALLGATVLTFQAATAAAQTTPPRRAEQGHAWYQLFEEHKLDRKWTLLTELQLRRADVAGTTPQQALVRYGAQYDLGGGARVAFGHLFQHSSVYGEAPAAAPTDEHRIWQQLLLSDSTGPVAWAHRFRTEQRWLEQTTAGSPWRFRQRARAFTRATVDLAPLGVAIPRTYLTGWGELFATVGASSNGQVFDQSRLALQAGYRFSRRFRVEAGYMQQYVQRSAGRETENNHTLIVSLFTTTGG